MQQWTRDHTRTWIKQLENRVEDFQVYLARTEEWCEENHVYSKKIEFVCKLMTLVWVSHLRDEPISKHEIFEILQVKNWVGIEDAEFGFNPIYANMELEELLEFIVNSYQ